MVLSLRTSAVSDIGRTRKKNDDSGYAGTHFAMVADGMGGAPAGDLASAVAIQVMQRLDGPPPEDMLEALAGSLHRANERLSELIEEDSSVDGMGTTVTAVLFDGHQIGVAHLGDSRGYLWRDGELLRLTHDHTWVQSLIDEGRITEEEAKTHSHRSLLLKVLDGRHDNEPELTLYDVRPGDRILLCSDGLSGFVEPDQIARVLEAGTAADVAQELTQLALDSHSTDNVTVVVADVVEEPADEAAPIVVGSAAEDAPGRFGRLRTWTTRDHGERGETLIDPDSDPEEQRYAPREPGRYRWLKRGLVALVVLALIIVGGAYAYSWTQDQYFVAEHDGNVAIYQGIQADLPGVNLSSVYRVEDLTLDELPSFRRSQVIDGMTADNLDDAERIVAQLVSFADRCADRVQATSTSPTSPKPPRSTRPATSRPGTGGQSETQRPPRSSATKQSATKPATTATTHATVSTGESGSDAGEECAGVSPDTGSTAGTGTGATPQNGTGS